MHNEPFSSKFALLDASSISSSLQRLYFLDSFITYLPQFHTEQKFTAIAIKKNNIIKILISLVVKIQFQPKSSLIAYDHVGCPSGLLDVLQFVKGVIILYIQAQTSNKAKLFKGLSMYNEIFHRVLNPISIGSHFSDFR